MSTDRSGTAVFDLARALANAMGELELLSELAGIFCDSADTFLEQIAAAIAGRDGDALRQSAHTLKGSMSPFCAADAHAAAVRLEKMGAEDDFAGVDRARRELEREVARLRGALREILIDPGG